MRERSWFEFFEVLAILVAPAASIAVFIAAAVARQYTADAIVVGAWVIALSLPSPHR